MTLPAVSAGRVARTAGHLLLGFAGTAVLVVVLLPALQPLRVPVYNALYLAVGPWTATTTATVVAFALAVGVAVSVPTLLAEYARNRSEYVRPLGAALAGLVLLPVLLVVLAAFAGVVGLLAAVVAFAAFVVAVRALGAWPGGVTAFAGGVPVLVVALLLLGFGLGWGGGYDVVATELPASAVNGSADASFDEAPELRDDLLSPSPDAPATCRESDEGRRTCRLSLRGYEHEARAARFLDRHGVRCPLRGSSTPETRNRSFVAEADGRYYRVRCTAYGD